MSLLQSRLLYQKKMAIKKARKQALIDAKTLRYELAAKERKRTKAKVRDTGMNKDTSNKDTSNKDTSNKDTSNKDASNNDPVKEESDVVSKVEGNTQSTVDIKICRYCKNEGHLVGYYDKVKDKFITTCESAIISSNNKLKYTRNKIKKNSMWENNISKNNNIVLPTDIVVKSITDNISTKPVCRKTKTKISKNKFSMDESDSD
jgi:hypothetical protein